jgi:hypothetical protein
MYLPASNVISAADSLWHCYGHDGVLKSAVVHNISRFFFLCPHARSELNIAENNAICCYSIQLMVNVNGLLCSRCFMPVTERWKQFNSPSFKEITFSFSVRH